MKLNVNEIAVCNPEHCIYDHGEMPYQADFGAFVCEQCDYTVPPQWTIIGHVVGKLGVKLLNDRARRAV
jgi:hypothetical protein